MPTEIHVAPDGDDGAERTADSPLETLDTARDALRDATDDGGSVILHDGTYRRADTFVLEPQDSGSADAPITYRAADGASPTISGGRVIDGWEPVDEAVPGLPDGAVDEVYVADVPRLDGEPWEFLTLYDADGRLTRAHTPHRQHADPGDGEPTDRLLHLPDEDPIGWSNVGAAELFLTPHPPWTVNYLPIDEVDPDRGVVRTGLPATYGMESPRSWNGSAAFYRVENVFEGLAEPGRWVLDTDAERLYLWPRDGDGTPDDIVAPATTELVRFQGDHDEREWVRHVRFEGLTFARGDRLRWGPDRDSLQHDWALHDEPDALVRLRGAEECTVADCRFVKSGSTGCRLDLHAVDCSVHHCEFGRLGGSGVLLAGFGPGSRDANHHNEIRANHIHHVGQLWWHAPGIFVSQSGHLDCIDNHIHHLPYTGVVVSGPRPYVFAGDRPREGSRTIRWDEVDDCPHEPPHVLGLRHARHVDIAHNEIHHTVERLGDGNGIYLSGTGESCAVRRNHVHDIEGDGADAAIRNDDHQFHALVSENVVHRITGKGIISKCVNQIQNNVVVDCYGDGSGHLSVEHRGPTHGTGLRRNVAVQGDRADPAPLVDFTDLLRQACSDDNCYHSLADPDAARETIDRLREEGQGTRSIAVDPGVLSADGEIRIPDDTPAREVGFRPFDEWGPRAEPGPRTGS
jgi:hypothetical protein